MAQQQEKKKTSKRKKPSHKAYRLRDMSPETVLGRVIQSSGFGAGVKYAEKHGLVGTLNEMVADRPWVRRKEMASLNQGKSPRKTRGRAMRRLRRMRARQKDAATFLSSPERQAAVHSEAIEMDTAMTAGK